MLSSSRPPSAGPRTRGRRGRRRARRRSRSIAHGTALTSRRRWRTSRPRRARLRSRSPPRGGDGGARGATKLSSSRQISQPPSAPSGPKLTTAATCSPPPPPPPPASAAAGTRERGRGRHRRRAAGLASRGDRGLPPPSPSRGRRRAAAAAARPSRTTRASPPPEASSSAPRGPWRANATASTRWPSCCVSAPRRAARVDVPQRSNGRSTRREQQRRDAPARAPPAAAARTRARARGRRGRRGSAATARVASHTMTLASSPPTHRGRAVDAARHLGARTGAAWPCSTARGGSVFAASTRSPSAIVHAGAQSEPEHATSPRARTSSRRGRRPRRPTPRRRPRARRSRRTTRTRHLERERERARGARGGTGPRLDPRSRRRRTRARERARESARAHLVLDLEEEHRLDRARVVPQRARRSALDAPEPHGQVARGARERGRAARGREREAAAAPGWSAARDARVPQHDGAVARRRREQRRVVRRPRERLDPRAVLAQRAARAAERDVPHDDAVVGRAAREQRLVLREGHAVHRLGVLRERAPLHVRAVERLARAVVHPAGAASGFHLFQTQ